jgi:pyridoxamine 5'-phosphate oxidase
MHEISGIRTDYKLKSLTEEDASADAIQQFTTWWNDAIHSQIEEVNAMTLCTADSAGQPDGRIVLLKGYDADGFVFFTNYESRKGREIAENPRASLVFFWKELERQIRIQGMIEKTSEAESDAYFHSRPLESRIGAWASPQSSVIASRDIIEENVMEVQKNFSGSSIDRPPHWGGFRVIPAEIEFWQGRPGRLHDRLRYTKSSTGWEIKRLAP